VATAGEMSHLMDLQGTARARFARQLMRREERFQLCVGCRKTYTSMRVRERFCSPECCVQHFANHPFEIGRKPCVTIEVGTSTENHALQAPALKPAPQETILGTIPCSHCKAPFHPKKVFSKFCSNKCRVYSHRKNNLG